MTKGIFWIASYPKSGNTWLRIFLENLLCGASEPVSINGLSRVLIACSRSMFDDHAGIESSDLTLDEIDTLRPRFYEHLADKYDNPLYMKIHDAYTRNSRGVPLIPANVTAGVVYIVRNPLDVAVSYASHFGCTLDRAISCMADREHGLVKKETLITHQFRQRLLSWSGHVMSWMSSGLPVCLIRYEDMKLTPHQTFKKVVRFLNLDSTETDIGKAIDFSSFDTLKRQENTMGFRERPITASSFFRKGVVGAWQSELTHPQVECIANTHKDVMQQFGYTDTIQSEEPYLTMAH